MNKIKFSEMKREIPKGIEVVKNINGIDIYNMNIVENIKSRTKKYPEVPMIDYFGNVIKYGELQDYVDSYSKSFDALGLKPGEVVTLTMPPSIESNMFLLSTEDRNLISNNVNALFLKKDLLRYTDQKKSDTLVILDIYLPFIASQLKNSKIKNVIVTSLKDMLLDNPEFYNYSKMLPEEVVKAYFYTPNMLDVCAKELLQAKHINFMTMNEFLSLGKNREVTKSPFDINSDSIYSYTSGTTGDPKCIVFKKDAAGALLEQHNNVDLNSFLGERSLQVIPTSHTTGMFYGLYLAFGVGKTIIPQPIYNKETFAWDLVYFDINNVLAAGSFWNHAAMHKYDKPNALKNLWGASTGGEPLTLGNVNRVNKWLKENGQNNKLLLGGGTGEEGSSVIAGYDLNMETKTNETGYPIPGAVVVLKDANGNVVKKGERGFLHLSNAAAADRYLDNEEATNKYWYFENGYKMADVGDIAVQNEDDSYSMLGRATDSIVDENGKTRYLFDLEYQLDESDPIQEWEISAFDAEDNKKAIVAHVVVKPEMIGNEAEVIEYLVYKYKLDGVKIHDVFQNSEVTGKRAYLDLSRDCTDFYTICDKEDLMHINFAGDNTERNLVNRNSVNKKNKTRIRK